MRWRSRLIHSIRRQATGLAEGNAFVAEQAVDRQGIHAQVQVPVDVPQYVDVPRHVPNHKAARAGLDAFAREQCQQSPSSLCGRAGMRRRN